MTDQEYDYPDGVDDPHYVVTGCDEEENLEIDLDGGLGAVNE